MMPELPVEMAVMFARLLTITVPVTPETNELDVVPPPYPAQIPSEAGPEVRGTDPVSVIGPAARTDTKELVPDVAVSSAAIPVLWELIIPSLTMVISPEPLSIALMPT